MRTALVVSALCIVAVAVGSASAQYRRQAGLVIDVKPRSWLDAGTSVPVGRGRDYMTNTGAFNGVPVSGISSRYEANLPERGLGQPLFTFDLMGGAR